MDLSNAGDQHSISTLASSSSATKVTLPPRPSILYHRDISNRTIESVAASSNPIALTFHLNLSSMSRYDTINGTMENSILGASAIMPTLPPRPRILGLRELGIMMNTKRQARLLPMRGTASGRYDHDDSGTYNPHKHASPRPTRARNSKRVRLEDDQDGKQRCRRSKASNSVSNSIVMTFSFSKEASLHYLRSITPDQPPYSHNHLLNNTQNGYLGHSPSFESEDNPAKGFQQEARRSNQRQRQPTAKTARQVATISKVCSCLLSLASRSISRPLVTNNLGGAKRALMLEMMSAPLLKAAMTILVMLVLMERLIACLETLQSSKEPVNVVSENESHALTPMMAARALTDVTNVRSLRSPALLAPSKEGSSPKEQERKPGTATTFRQLQTLFYLAGLYRAINAVSED